MTHNIKVVFVRCSFLFGLTAFLLVSSSFSVALAEDLKLNKLNKTGVAKGDLDKSGSSKGDLDKSGSGCRQG